MNSLIDQPVKERGNLIVVSVLCAIGMVGVIVNYLLNVTNQVAEGYVVVRLTGVGGAVVPTGSGLTLEPTGDLDGYVDVADLPSGAVSLIRFGDASEAVLWAVVIGLVGYLAVRVMRGFAFNTGTIRTLNGLTGAILALWLVPSGSTRMGTNWVISTLELEGRFVDPASASNTTLWITYLIIGFCLLVQVVFRSGVRLARDQDGTI